MKFLTYWVKVSLFFSTFTPANITRSAFLDFLCDLINTNLTLKQQLHGGIKKIVMRSCSPLPDSSVSPKCTRCNNYKWVHFTSWRERLVPTPLNPPVDSVLKASKRSKDVLTSDYIILADPACQVWKKIISVDWYN